MAQTVYTTCPHCGEVKRIKRGKNKLASGQEYQKYYCKACGKYSSDAPPKPPSMDEMTGKTAQQRYNKRHQKRFSAIQRERRAAEKLLKHQREQAKRRQKARTAEKQENN